MLVTARTMHMSVVHFLLGRFPNFQHFYAEKEVLTCQGMVEVEQHFCFVHFCHSGPYQVTLLVAEVYNIVNFQQVFCQLSVNDENIFRYVFQRLIVGQTICICRSNTEAYFVANCFTFQV